MKRWGLLIVLAALVALVPVLRSRSQAAAQVEDTLGIVKAIKTQSRALWSGKPDPADLSLGNWHTSWKGAITLQLYARGTLSPQRVIGITLADVPQSLCPDLLQRLDAQRQENLWLKLEADGQDVPNQPFAATRRQLCADKTALSVYFTF